VDGVFGSTATAYVRDCFGSPSFNTVQVAPPSVVLLMPAVSPMLSAAK
jgi:hypothetical protein